MEIFSHENVLYKPTSQNCWPNWKTCSICTQVTCKNCGFKQLTASCFWINITRNPVNSWTFDLQALGNWWFIQFFLWEIGVKSQVVWPRKLKKYEMPNLVRARPAYTVLNMTFTTCGICSKRVTKRAPFGLEFVGQNHIMNAHAKWCIEYWGWPPKETKNIYMQTHTAYLWWDARWPVSCWTHQPQRHLSELKDIFQSHISPWESFHLKLVQYKYEDVTYMILLHPPNILVLSWATTLPASNVSSPIKISRFHPPPIPPQMAVSPKMRAVDRAGPVSSARKFLTGDP